jgi:hypothetical protein
MSRRDYPTIIFITTTCLILTVVLAVLGYIRRSQAQITFAWPAPSLAYAEVIPTATVIVSPTSTATPLPTATLTPEPSAAETDTATPLPSPTSTRTPAPRATSQPVVVYIPPTATPTPAPTRDSLAQIITIGDCRAQAYHLGPEQTGLRGGMVAEMAMSPLWTTAECGALPIARCMVDVFNPEIVFLALNDGGGSDINAFYDGNIRLIGHIREFEGADVRLFVVIGPTTQNIGNPFGPGVVSIDLKDVIDRAAAHGITLLEPDNFHLRPILAPYPEPWQQNYANNLFYTLYHRAIAIGQGVVSIDEEFFAANPYQP